jgi:hypothetical protein
MALIPTEWSSRWRGALRLLAAALILAVSIQCTAFPVDEPLTRMQTANAVQDTAECAVCAAQCEWRLLSAKREIVRLRRKLRMPPGTHSSSPSRRPTRRGPGRKRSRTRDSETDASKTGIVAAEILTASVGPRRALQQDSGCNLVPTAAASIPSPCAHTHGETLKPQRRHTKLVVGLEACRLRLHS